MKIYIVDDQDNGPLLAYSTEKRAQMNRKRLIKAGCPALVIPVDVDVADVPDYRKLAVTE